MARLLHVFAVVLVLFQGNLGHFQLNYPASRGFDESLEPTAACGTFDTAGNRTQFPLQNGLWRPARGILRTLTASIY